MNEKDTHPIKKSFSLTKWKKLENQTIPLTQ